MTWRRRPGGWRRDQRGFTVLELLASVALIGLIAAPLGATISHTFQATQWGAEEAAVLGDMQTAFAWLGRDIPAASSTDLPDGGPATDSVTLTWRDRYGDANTLHQAAYALVGPELRRTQDGATHTVAWRVTAVSFLRSSTLVTVTITASSATLGTVQAQYLFRMRSEG